MILGALIAVGAVIVGGLSYKAARDAQKAAKRAADAMAGVLVNKESNIEAIPVIYGERRVGGTRVFVHTEGGEKNEYLYIALVLCEGEVESISDIEIDDYPITDNRFQSVIEIPKIGGGGVTLTSNLISAETFTGADNQAASTVLSETSKWTSDHRLRGVAYIAIRLKWDENVFSGIPEITALVKGKKVYDPRDATTAWSDNPALCLRDYLTNNRYGKGLPASAIDDVKFVQAANDCDSFTVTPYSGAPSTIKLFRTNAVIDTDDEIFRNVERFLLGCRGFLPYSQGKYGLVIDQAVSVASTPVLDTTQIIGGISIQGENKKDKFNRVIVEFPNPNTDWQPDQAIWPTAGSTEESTFQAEDGGTLLVDEVDLETITDYYAARDFARILCLRSRNALRCSLQATSESMNLVVGDVVRVTHPTPGWTEKPFQVEELTIGYDGVVGINLIEYDSTIYAYDPASEESTYPDTDLPDPFIVAPPTNLSVVARANIADDGATIPYLEITWTAANDAFVNGYLVTVTPSTGNSSSFTVSTTSYDFFVLDSTKTYSVSVRAINALGARSTAVTVSGVSPIVDTTAPGVPSNPGVTGEFKQIKVEWDNPTDSDFSYVEIKRSGTDVEANAVTIAVTRADYFIDGPYVGVAQRYYWLRAVDLSGNASAWVYAGSGTTIQLVPNDFDDGIITIDYLNAGLQTSINNAVDTTTFTDGIADLRQEILNVEVETGDVLNLENGQDFLIQNLGDVAIYVSESNQILNQNISNVQSTVTGLENTIVDLVSGVSDVYVTPEPPVAGVGGIPDPIPTFSRWYDSDDSNEPYYWDGSSWVSLADPRIASNAADIVTLQSGINTANSNISANSTAITALDTLTITQGDSITSLSSDVTTLQSDLTSAEGDITANASAISGLDTRVTAAEGTITTQSSDITALETSVSDLETDTTANTSAISGLDTRVTQTESDITANSTSITALETTVNDGITGVAATASGLSALDTRVTTAEGNITTNASDITALELTVNDPDDGVAANASAVSSLDARVTTAENTLSATASDTTDLQVSFTDLTRIQDESDNVLTTEGGQELILNLPTDVASATGAATASLDTRITAAEGTITVQSSDIVSLRADLTSLDGEVSGNATALETLTTRVTTAEGSITSNATDITSLESSLSLANTDITNNATAITSLDTRVTSAEGSITSQASDIASLQADVTSLDSTVSGNSTAISGLDARVTSAEGTITSQASDITSLESSVTDLETDTTNNATAITSLDTRVTSAEGSITSQATDITNIQSSITDIETDVSGNADAITGLTTRVTQTETDITSQASDITSLESSVTDLETDTTNNATAITSLDTRVTATETTNTVQSSQITILVGALENTNEDVAANASGVTALDVRVTSAEGTITSQSSDITALESSVTDLETSTTSNATAITSLDTRVTQTEEDITSQASDLTALETDVTNLATDVSGNADAITGIDTRVTSAEESITSQATSITNLESSVTDLETNTTNNATAITSLDTRVTSAEESITSQATSITNLESSVTDLETNTTNNATAITSLDTRVTDAESDITSQASAITTLETSVGDNTTSISTAQTTIDGITAQYSVVIDNNDHVSGFGLVSDIIAGNPTSAFIVNADQFAIGGAGVITDEYPFVVYTQNTTVSKGGENYTLAAGAYIADAFIQTAAIDSAQIRDAAITTAKIDDAQITTAKIGDAQITTAKIDDAQITSAKIDNLAVDTIKIADQAVTLPESGYTESGINKNSGVTEEQVLQTVTVSSSGAPTEIFGAFTIDSTYNLTASHTIRIKRGSTILYEAVITVGSSDQYPFSAAITDSLTDSGSRTYTITAQGFGSWSISNRYLRTLELKK